MLYKLRIHPAGAERPRLFSRDRELRYQTSWPPSVHVDELQSIILVDRTGEGGVGTGSKGEGATRSLAAKKISPIIYRSCCTASRAALKLSTTFQCPSTSLTLLGQPSPPQVHSRMPIGASLLPLEVSTQPITARIRTRQLASLSQRATA